MGVVVAVFPWFFMNNVPRDQQHFLQGISLGMITLVVVNLLSDVGMRKLGVKRGIRWRLAQAIGAVAAFGMFQLLLRLLH